MKQEIRKIITNKSIDNDYEFASNEYTIDEAIAFLTIEKEKGATHVSIGGSTSYDSGYISVSIETRAKREETDEEYNRRLQLEESARKEKEIQESLLLKRREAEEKATYLKLKQKFEK